MGLKKRRRAPTNPLEKANQKSDNQFISDHLKRYARSHAFLVFISLCVQCICLKMQRIGMIAHAFRQLIRLALVEHHLDSPKNTGSLPPQSLSLQNDK